MRKNFKLRRRLWGFFLLFVASIGVWGVCSFWKMTLRPGAVYIGSLLAFLILFLTLFNARKKIPFIPLFKVSTWTQLHIYVGYFSLIVFLFHLDFSWPNGLVEQLLAITFTAVTLSGVLGLFLSRWLPRRLTHSGESLVFERIPCYRRQVREEAEELVLQAEKESASSSLSDLYVDHLDCYFRSRPGVLTAVLPLPLPYRQILGKVISVQRYLNTGEKESMEKLSSLIEAKRNMDYQDSAQRLLKLWLFVHIPLTYCLLLLSAVHIYFALYYGGWS